MFDPNYLAGIPAPLWLIFFLKVLGFVLHLVPMGLWAVALPIGLLGAICRPETSPFGRFGRRILKQMPIFIALGINFGIVPLLFIQTLYPKPFYTATILIAWHWFAIIPLLLIGYYGVYIVSFAVSAPRGTVLRRLLFPVGAVASLCFLAIGLLIGNGMTLMAHSDRWTAIFEKTQIAGAVTGLGTNMSDPTLWMRLATMFALALLTTGVWMMADAALFTEGTRDSNRAYRRRMSIFSVCFALFACVILCVVETIAKGAAIGAAVLGNQSGQLALDYPFFGYVPLSALLLFVAIVVAAWRDYGGKLLTAILLLHIVTLTTFGVIRQIGQHAEISVIVQSSYFTENVQWQPIALFLVTFVLGVLCIAWIVRQLLLLPTDAPAGATGTP